MIVEQTIRTLIDEKLANSDVFLVECRVKTDNKIRVFIDSERGITIDDCVALSRHIEGNLNREQEDFALDVSSAGLDLPLRIPRQFKKNIGRDVQVVMNDGTEIKGKLVEAADENFKVLPEVKKKKKDVRAQHVVPQQVSQQVPQQVPQQAPQQVPQPEEAEPIQPVSINYTDQKNTKIILIF